MIGLATSLPAVAEKLYSITDLGTLGGGYSEANGINNLGQVVGASSTLSGSHAFRTAPNSPINPSTDDLGVLNDSCISRARADGEGSSTAYGINDLGQVVGLTRFFFSNRSSSEAFRTAPNSPINPATDGLGSFYFNGTFVFCGIYGGEAYSINNLGQVVATVISPVPQAFLTAPNRPINPATDNLGSLAVSASETHAKGINNFGQVVGSSYTRPTGGREHAFRTPPNSLIQALSNHSIIRLPKAWNFGLTYNAYMQRPINPSTDDLGTLGGASSNANGINDLGQAVGSSETASGDTHAFRTAPNSPINPSTDDLGTLGGRRSVANGINNFGQVVGSSSIATTANGDTHAFLYDEGQMLDLNNLIPTGSNFVLRTANAINNKGQIVGSGSING